MSLKSRNQFDGVMKGNSKVGDNAYVATTTKRMSLIVPEGVRVFDTDLDKWFAGDDSTLGGRSLETSKQVRRVLSKMSGASGLGFDYSTNKFSGAITSGWRTGDQIQLVSGLNFPSGYDEGTSYYVQKDGAENVTDFYLCTGRAGALSGGSVGRVSGYPSGTQNFLASNYNNDAFTVTAEDDVLVIDGVSGANTVAILPYIATNDGFSVIIKKPLVGTVDADVCLSGSDVNGNISDVSVDGLGSVVLNRNYADYINVTANAEGATYYKVGGAISGVAGIASA